jgi:chromosome segregation ATPase
MSFDERIDRLTARHEALAESVEMLRDRTAETAANLDRLEGRIDRLGEHVEKLTEQVEKLTEQVEKLTGQVEKLTATTQLNFDRLTTAMLGLTEHVAGHERRITGLEGRA